MRRTFIRGLVPLAALCLVAGACSDDDGATESAPSGPSASTTAGTGTSPDSVATGSTPTTAEEVQTGESLLDTVIANDTIRCGVRDDLPGFSTLDDAGEHVGFDADFCRVIAAGVLGDATKVTFVDLETDQRFTALQSGEVDVLVRNTTWTASRDGIEGVTFLHPTYYDGQRMMVGADSGIATIDDMDGLVVCVAGGTTSEGNVASEFARRGLEVEVQSFEDVDLLQEAFINGRCDGWSSDASQLVGLRSNFPDGPDALVILEEVFSEEPLTPGVRDNDTRWAQAVEWTIYATILAEASGITQANVADMAVGDDAAIVQFLGGENADGVVLDTGLDLDPAFALNIVEQVGNYGEIFERNLADLGLERGRNALWTEGGLQYAPPYR